MGKTIARQNASAFKTQGLPLAICGVILAVYLALPTRSYYWDGVGFALAIEDSPHFHPGLFHPNHLFYTPFGYIEYQLLHALGLAPRALTVLQITNSLLSAAAALVFFRLLLASLNSFYLSAVLTLLFAFSATWWKFSTDANSYIPSVLFLLLCFHKLLSGRRSQSVTLGLLHAGAMLFHQLAIWFYPVALVGLWRQSDALGFRQRVGVAARYTAAAFLPTTAAYGGAFYWKTGSLSLTDFLRWITSHSPEVHFSFDIARNALYSLRGGLRLFLGGRMAAEIRQPQVETLVLISLLLLVLAVGVARMARSAGDFRRLWKAWLQSGAELRGPLVLSLAWIAAYLIFLFFWLPGNTFYRLFYFPALVLLLGIFLAPYEAACVGKRKYRAALCVAVIFLFNLAFYVVPNTRVEANPPLALALQLSRLWNPKTVVYYATFNTDDWVVRYFNRETTWRLLEAGELSELESQWSRVREEGSNIWLDTTALERIRSLAEGEAWLLKRATRREEFVAPGYRMVFQEVVPIGREPQAPATEPRG